MIFINKYKNKYGKIVNLKEAAPDNNAGETANQSTTDNTAEADTSAETSSDNTTNETENNADTQNQENKSESESDNDNQNDSSSDDNTDTFDFDDSNTPSESSESDDSSEDSNDSGDDNNENEEEVDEIKKAEEDILSNLSNEQLDIKHKELKNRYLDMYDMTSDVIDRISSITVTEDKTFVIDYVSTTLSNLRDMIVDYINDVYKTKSYTENLMNYNRFLASLNGINKILEEIDVER